MKNKEKNKQKIKSKRVTREQKRKKKFQHIQNIKDLANYYRQKFE